MSYDIRNIQNINHLIMYFSKVLNWDIDTDSFDDIDDISYDFTASDLGLKEEAFVKIKSIKQLPPMVDGQKWGIFCIEFDSKRFEVTALRKVLSGLVPSRRNTADHAVWNKEDLLFLCFWGEDNNRTIGVAHFEDRQDGLPQIKMTYCAPAIEDTIHIQDFVNKIGNLVWPTEVYNYKKWHDDWSKAFTTNYKQVIRDSQTLTMQLAKEAVNIRDRILETLKIEIETGYVHQLFKKFKETLIHDMSEKDFADMYAQTVVYGLFSARCMDESQEDYSAAEAVECIPNTNPFLKSLMKECLGSRENSKLSFDELEIGNVVDLLMHTNTDEIIKDFNRQTGGGKEDPVIHFYEEFLAAYDKTQKVQRGVYYTPQPIVNFMVRAVDQIIKKEFGLENGLASIETKRIKYKRQSKYLVDGYHYKEVEDIKNVPSIQILDPATGTGTFIRQIILQIYDDFKANNPQLGSEEIKQAWNRYVPEHLLPRLNAFELMMAPYAVAHMKLAMVLRDTGYEFNNKERLHVYLTNSLEQAGGSDKQVSIFDDPLASESVAANAVKKNTGINVIIGNPPYSCESSNNNTWIQDLMLEFKREPGSDIKLQEQNYKAINDDYVKFYRLALEYANRTSNSIVSFITPHGFLDNPTFRGMRWRLLDFFSSIYVIDLHGDSRRKETCPDGSKDENVFDIQQGVCIFIGIKRANEKTSSVYRYDLYGLRTLKYDWLNTKSFSTIEWNLVDTQEPYYFFENRDTSYYDEYNEGFSIKDLFVEDVMGIATARDSIVIDSNYEVLKERFERLANPSISDDILAEELYGTNTKKANLSNVQKGWSLTEARKKIYNKDISQYIHPISYRPLDNRFIFYHPYWVDRDRSEIMKHFLSGDNLGLCLIRISRDDVFATVVTDNLTDKTILSSKDNANVFPLYLYDDNGINRRRANYNHEVIREIENRLGLTFDEEKSNDTNNTFSSVDLLDYIYAILFSNKYREKYRAVLKSDYPRIPYPATIGLFKRLVGLGRELRNLHLLKTEDCFARSWFFYGEGNNVIESIKYCDEKIYINRVQYFSNISEKLWIAYIAGYQPLQKWLKDRKGHILTEVDISHYIHMIAVIEKTISVIQDIDSIIEL